MTKLQLFLSELVIWTELLCAVVALVKLKSLKETYWKWFALYVILIFGFEAFSKWGLVYQPFWRKYYYDFFVIPFQFLFFYWLYAVKSLARKPLFWISVGVYLSSFLPHFFYLEETRVINSLSYTIGVLGLLIMAYFEFSKQVQSETILQFQENKMFYINVSVVLFYVGTLPFFAFDQYLYAHANTVWWYYLTFFLIDVNLMYLLFTASFIWGKPKP